MRAALSALTFFREKKKFIRNEQKNVSFFGFPLLFLFILYIITCLNVSTNMSKRFNTVKNIQTEMVLFYRIKEPVSPTLT